MEKLNQNCQKPTISEISIFAIREKCKENSHIAKFCNFLIVLSNKWINNYITGCSNSNYFLVDYYI